MKNLGFFLQEEFCEGSDNRPKFGINRPSAIIIKIQELLVFNNFFYKLIEQTGFQNSFDNTITSLSKNV